VSDLHTNGIANRAPTGAQDDIVERLQQVARANGCEAGRGCSEAAAEIKRLRAERDCAQIQAAHLAQRLVTEARLHGGPP